MAYLGTPPQSGFITTAKQRVTSSTNNYVDLDHSISSIADVIVFVNFVKQDTTNLSLTTSTRITLGGTLVSSDIVEIHYLGKAVNTQTPGTGTVTNDMLAGSITDAKISDLASSKLTGTIPTARLGSGTASSSTFLRGDSTFASAGKTVGLGFYTDYTSNNFSSTSYSQHPGFIFNYNIQESGSLIFFRLTASVRNDSSGGNRFMTLKVNYLQNGGSDTTLFERALNSSEGENGTTILSGTFTSSSTGECQFRLYVKSSSGGATVRIPSDYGVQGTFLEGQVLEIGQ